MLRYVRSKDMLSYWLLKKLGSIKHAKFCESDSSNKAVCLFDIMLWRYESTFSTADAISRFLRLVQTIVEKF